MLSALDVPATLTAAATLITALATLVVVLRGGQKASVGHAQLGEAIVNVHNAVAEVSKEVGGTVQPLLPPEPPEPAPGP